MTAEDLQGDNTSPVTYIATSIPPIVAPPDSVSGATVNLVVDSGFHAPTYSPGPTHGGLKSYIVASADPYWYFFGIDDISWGLVGNGPNSPEYAEFGNHLVQDSPTPTDYFYGISWPITVVPGQWYTLSAYLSYQGPNTSFSGGPFVAIVDVTGSNTYTTIYAKVNQPAGGNGRVNTTWFCPTDGSVTSIAVMLNNDKSSLAIPYYLHMGKPMLQLGQQLTGYLDGPDTPGTVKTTQSISVGNPNTTATQSAAASLPTVTSNTTTPTSGSLAPTIDQQPQGSLRINSAASSSADALFAQVASSSTTPDWVALGGTANINTTSSYTVPSPGSSGTLAVSDGTVFGSGDVYIQVASGTTPFIGLVTAVSGNNLTVKTLQTGSTSPISSGSLVAFGGAGVSTLENLSDVSVSSLVKDQGLIYNGTDWTNQFYFPNGLPTDFMLNVTNTSSSSVNLTDDTGSNLLTSDIGTQLTSDGGAGTSTWYTSGASGATITFYYPDATTFTLTGSGTSGSPNTIIGVSSGQTLYPVCYATYSSGAWSITVNFYTSVPTLIQLAPAFNYNAIPLIANYNMTAGVVDTASSISLHGGSGSTNI